MCLPVANRVFPASLPPTFSFSRQPTDDDDDLSDDSMFKDNDLSDDSDSDDDDLFAPAPVGAAPSQGEGRVLAGRARWLKKPESEKKKKDKASKVAAPKKQGEAKTGPSVALRRVQTLEKNLTVEEVNLRLAEVVASRGRKGTDPREALRKLEMLSRQARRHGPREEIPVLMNLISVMYDSHRVIDDYMDLHTWRTAFRCLMRVVALLSENLELVLGMLPSEDATQASGGSSTLMKKNGEAVEEAPVDEEKADNVIKVVGALETFLSRLEGDFTKSLQQINPHTQVSTAVTLAPDSCVMFAHSQTCTSLRPLASGRAMPCLPAGTWWRWRTVELARRGRYSALAT